jgi:hypothetical protein
MSRDQTRNIEAFKIGGTQVNEFEFHKNQERMSEQFEQHAGDKVSGAKPATKAERVAELIAEAHRKVEKRKKHEAAKAGVSKSAATGSDRKGSAAKAGASKKSVAARSNRKDSAKSQMNRPVSTKSGGTKLASKQSTTERKSQTRAPQRGSAARMSRSTKKTREK